MTLLRKQMLDELQRRIYSQTTVKGYLKIVEAFAQYFHRSPDQLHRVAISNQRIVNFADGKVTFRWGLHAQVQATADDCYRRGISAAVPASHLASWLRAHPLLWLPR